MRPQALLVSEYACIPVTSRDPPLLNSDLHLTEIIIQYRAGMVAITMRDRAPG